MITNQELIDKAIEQIKSDVDCKDYTAIEELLKASPEVNLKAFLNEHNNVKLNYFFVVSTYITSDKYFDDIPFADKIAAMRKHLDAIEATNNIDAINLYDAFAAI